VDIEQELRTVLAERAETLDVPTRQISISPRPAKAQPRRGWLAVAAVATTVGILASTNGIGDPQVELPDLPAADIASLAPQLADAPDFSWQLQSQITGSEMVRSGDNVWVFASTEADGSGLEAWSYNGSVWSAHGSVIGDEFVMGRVFADNNGFVAMGHREDLEFPYDSGGTLLSSTNGLTWQEHVIPMVGAGPLRRAELVVAGNGRAMISIASGLPEYEAAAAAFASRDFQTAFDLYVRHTGTAIEIVSQQFDLVLTTYDVEDLTFPANPSETVSWYWSDDLATWHQLDRVFPDWVPQSDGTFTENGDFVLRTTLPNGESALAVSPDLRSWETMPDPIDGFGPLIPFRDSILATVDGRFRPRVFQTYGLEEWAPLTAADPETDADDYVTVLGAGDIGIVFVYANPEERRSRDRVVVETDEGSISLDPSSGLIVAAEGSTWRIDFSDGVRDLARYNPATDQIELSMPGDTEPRLVVDATDLVEASHRPVKLDRYDTSIFFSADGEQWRLIDFSEETNEGFLPTDVEVFENEVMISFINPETGLARLYIGQAFLR